ncbi:MAG: hypothetical protein AAF078_09275, partial [Planctomycetota bacterium]
MSSDAESFACPSCEKRYRWRAGMGGKKVECKACGAVIRVPVEPGALADLIREPQVAASGESGAGYDLADPSEVAEREEEAAGSASGGALHNGKCPACNAKLKPGAVVCMNCGFNLQTGQKLSTAVGAAPVAGEAAAGAPAVGAATLNRAVFDTRSKIDDAALDEDMARENQWKYLYTPLVLIAVGLVWTLFNAGVLGPMAIGVNPIIQAQGGATTGDRMTGALIVLLFFVLRILIQLPLML